VSVPLPPIEVDFPDLARWGTGNAGTPYLWTFGGERAGPHVLLQALTHGNEVCGAIALDWLLAEGFRPARGTVSFCFANVAAYETFDPDKPFDSRLITHNLNRIWSPAWLDGNEDSVELRRAREMRPAVAAADHILDIHSTSQDVVPFWVYPSFERNAAVARALVRPEVHLVMPVGLGSGTPLIQHGAHGQADGAGAALVVECGQHFKQATADLATDVAQNFLAHFGLIDRPMPNPTASPRRFELLRTHVIKHPSFAFARPVIGFETFAEGELIATDGAEEIRAPCDDCTIFMPARIVIVGREGVYLTKPMRS